MPPAARKSKLAIFLYKGHSQGHKVIDLGVIWKGIISGLCMPNMKSRYLTAQKLWPRLIFSTDRQTGQKLNTPELHSRGIKHFESNF